jgi:hypothetical protein
MEVPMRMPAFVAVLLIVLAAAAPSAAQQSVITPPQTPMVASLSGPRFGVTVLSDEIVESVADYVELEPVISQFGWQFEKQFYSKDGRMAMLNEWVLLFGGLDQGLAIPSLTWLVGLRTANGSEFGVGPNVGIGGVSFAIAAGTTIRTGFLNVPMNVAVVPSRNGMRISFLTGFSTRK